MAIIELENITKCYSDKKIFNKFCLEIERGECVGITGKSGAGKSTLLNIIGLLENFEEGRLSIDGVENISVNSKQADIFLRNRISYIFQNFALINNETIRYNLNLALKYVKGNKKEKDEKILAALDAVGLAENIIDKKAYELSGGEQQRVAIARVLLKPSRIVLADEPTGSLDYSNGQVVLELIKKINKSGKTIIIASHDENAIKICNRVVSL